MSRGTLLIQQGDEMGRTQQGNNNAYAQDNEITWVDWAGADRELIGFVAGLKRFRDAHPALGDDRFLTGILRGGKRDVVWLHPEGREMREADWHDFGASVLGVLFDIDDDQLLIWFNRRIETVAAVLPASAAQWTVAFRSDETVSAPIRAGSVQLPPRSVLALAPPLRKTRSTAAKT